MFESPIKSKYSILYAEDETKIRELNKELFSELFENVYIAEDGQEALDLYHEYKPDVVFLDISMPLVNGIQVAQEIRKTNAEVPIIILTAHDDKEYLLPAIDLRLHKFIKKGTIRFSELDRILQTIIEDLDNKKDSLSFWRITPKTHNPSFKWDLNEHKLYRNETEEIELTKKQTQIFAKFSKKRNEINKVVENDELAKELWGDDYDSETAKSSSEQKIRGFFYIIKKKLDGVELFKSVYNQGYKVVDF